MTLYGIVHSLDITIIASGFIASSASIVLLGRDKRLCTPNTNFLIHPISTYAWGKLPDIKNTVAFSEMLQEQFLGIYQKHSKVTKEMLQQETYFNAAKALDLQLVSAIV
jgi:ATP-dependent protease ClpP protease subunit